MSERRVRPLEWVEAHGLHYSGRDTIWYIIETNNDVSLFGNIKVSACDSIDAAKEAAQKDYETRILAALI